ncbi:mucoidy inhibitor MuiA family protein, partial [Flavobacterium sp.]|uniref:mucoidy inhibitor MuiA family protein n=1 Tax=Flavobacterium sp. TaxID=239 RepID=UPI0037C11DBD
MKNLFLLFVLVSTISFAQKPIFTTAKVKSATVYFNAAEISQTTAVNLPVGTSEIVVKNVADYLNESTVQIGAPNSVTVLSVQFSQNYISEYEIDETNPAIKKVRDSITIVQKEIKKVQIDSYSSQQTIALLDANQTVAGSNNGLNVAELMKLVDFYKTKRTELDNAVVILAEKETKLKEKLKNLNDKLEINTQKEEKSSKGKLIIQVMNEIAGVVNLDLNYITDNASWTPFYDLRAENITSPINMMYKAQVTQWTGIDWKKVKLTLSSGNPNQNNQAPLLNSWFLRYGNPYSRNGYSYREGDSKPNAGVTNTLQGQVAGVNIANGSGQPGSGTELKIRGAASIDKNSQP